jgi:hypothetical protein
MNLTFSKKKKQGSAAISMMVGDTEGNEIENPRKK